MELKEVPGWLKEQAAENSAFSTWATCNVRYSRPLPCTTKPGPRMFVFFSMPTAEAVAEATGGAASIDSKNKKAGLRAASFVSGVFSFHPLPGLRRTLANALPKSRRGLLGGSKAVEGPKSGAATRKT